MTLIDPEELRRIAAKAQEDQEAANNLKALEAKAKKLADDDELFESIIKAFHREAVIAAKAGKDSVRVWWMGDLGHINSDEITDYRPINWEIFDRLEQWCTDNGYVPVREPIIRPDRFTSYESYHLYASWAIQQPK